MGHKYEKAFQDIVDHLICAKVLVFADSSKLFILHADTSLEGLEAVLYQESYVQRKPDAFASKDLVDSEICHSM